MDYISKVALDLIKARRQGGHTEKVYTLIISALQYLFHNTVRNQCLHNAKLQCYFAIRLVLKLKSSRTYNVTTIGSNLLNK